VRTDLLWQELNRCGKLRDAVQIRRAA